MSGPIDTIREALDSIPDAPGHWPYDVWAEAREEERRVALAALTEVEHQLSAGRQDEQIEADVGEHYREERDQERARAVAAEAARDTLLREISEDYVLAGAYHEQQARAVAAETALAEKDERLRKVSNSFASWQQLYEEEEKPAWVARAEAAKRRADALADALRQIANAHSGVATRPIARAALDRQEQR